MEFWSVTGCYFLLIQIIYIMRNGKDVSVSLYHFMKFMKYFQFSGTFEDFYQDFFEGKGMLITLLWYNHADDQMMDKCVVLFSTMKAHN